MTKTTIAILIACLCAACTETDSVYHYVDEDERATFYYECLDHQKAIMTTRNDDCVSLSWSREMQRAQKRKEAKP